MTDLRGPIAVGLLLAAAGVVLAGWAVRRLAGPVFAHELTVLARRGYQPRLRAGLVVVLLVGLLFTYAGEFGWDAVAGQTPSIDPRSGRFAERFALTTLAVQLLAVVVLTPAVVGAAITEERDRGTLDLLRTSALTDREIVVGKLLARLAVVGGVVAAGLPVLALTLLFGGVSPRLMVDLYAVTAVTAFGLGAASLYLGTVLTSLRGVLGVSYGWVGLVSVLGTCGWTLPPVAGLSPVSTVFSLMARDSWLLGSRYWWASGVVFGLLYGGGGMVLMWVAIRRVRLVTVRRTDEPTAAMPVTRRFYARPPAEGEDPLVWQEREFGGRRLGGGELRFACGAAALFLFGSALFVGLATSVERAVWVDRAVARAVRPLLAAAAVLLPLAVGLRLAGSVAGERERQTLDALLMLPDHRRQILRAKAKAAVGWAAWGVWLVAGSLLVAVLVGGIRVSAGLVSAVQLTAVVAAAVGLAGWLTVRQRTGARATVLFHVALLTVNILPLLVAPLADLFGPEAGRAVRAISPVVAVWTSGRGVSWATAVALVPTVAYSVAGWTLWRAAERRIEKGERPA